MTDQEKLVLIKLVDAWNAFQQLPVLHPDDSNDFKYHIHRLEDMVAARQAIIKYNEEREENK